MLIATQIAGFIGAGLAGAAYVPQIWHLVRVHCSAGISRPAFGVWLAASVLVTAHAVASQAAVFVLLGGIQIMAISAILVWATKYRYSSCADHTRTRSERSIVEASVGALSGYDAATRETDSAHLS